MGLIIDAIVGMALLVAAVYLILPLIVWAMMWADTRAPIDEIDIDELPEDIADYFATSAGRLRELGFTRIGCFQMPSLMPGAAAVFDLHVSDDRHTLATVNSIAPADDHPTPVRRPSRSACATSTTC